MLATSIGDAWGAYTGACVPEGLFYAYMSALVHSDDDKKTR